MSRALSRMKRVEAVDDAFMDVDEKGNQRWMVTLKKGWAFHDGAKETADDPEGKNAAHCRGGSVREMQRWINDAEPCKCGRCVDPRG